MELSADSKLLLRIAGAAVWVASGIVFPACRGNPAYLIPTLMAFLLFFAAFWRLTAGSPPTGRARILGLLAVESISALCLITLHPYYMAANLLVVVGWQAALVLPAPAALAWILIQSVLPGPILGSTVGNQFVWPYVLAIIAFQLFGLVTARIVALEAAARASRDVALRELREAQLALTESAREAERLRIARELHDVLGHMLTGLKLQLDLANRVNPGARELYISRARDIAQDLLTEIRTLVSKTRATGVLDLRRSLELLVAGLREIDVKLEVDGSLAAIAPAEALVVLRIIQESTTNALRHARASELVIGVSAMDTMVDVRVVDNGPGVSEVRFGSGLAGMRERVSALGGTLEVHSAPSRGFAVIAQFPLRPLAA